MTKHRDYDGPAEAFTPSDLVVCQSADGWSLHTPGSTDEEIAAGEAPYLLSGDGEPTAADYEKAFRIYQAHA